MARGSRELALLLAEHEEMAEKAWMFAVGTLLLVGGGVAQAGLAIYQFAVQYVAPSTVLGVAQHVTTPDDTFDAADRALYDAKASGKDCVIAAPMQRGGPRGDARTRR
mgnify:CR=1 FL=1